MESQISDLPKYPPIHYLHSHGWIETDDQWVVVRLEPLHQPNRLYAQEPLCRKLTGLGAKIPGGKSLRIEVGDTPL